jgi:hypothetical protein
VDTGLAAGGYATLQAPMVVGLHCTYWRGVCRMRAMAFAGSLDAGRVLFLWAPGPTRTGVLDPTAFPSCVIDLGAGQTQCEMEIPWGVADKMLPLPASFATFPVTAYSGTAPAGHLQYGNGNLYVVVDAPLTSNQATTGIGLKVFFSWPELEFYVPSARTRYSVVCTSTINTAYSGEGSAVAVVPIRHLRQVGVAYQPWLHINPTKAAAGDTQLTWTYVAPLFGYPATTTTAVTNVARRLPTITEVSMVCYQGFRGSMKHRVVLITGVTDGEAGQAMCAGGVEGLTGWDHTTLLRSVALGVARYSSASLFNALYQRLVDFTGLSYFSNFGEVCGISVPWRGTALFRSTAYGTTAGVEALNAVNSNGQCVAYAVNIGTSNTANTSTTVGIDWFTAMGDDFVCVGFTGAPIISSGTF